MRLVYLYSLLFSVMGSLYYLLEKLWDGTSHWSMFVLGGVCGILIGLLNEHKLTWEMSLVKQVAYGMCVVLPLEFVTGVLLHKIIKVTPPVWDYSELPLNLMGQTSLVFAPVFIVPILLAIFIDDQFRWRLLGGERPHYHLL